MAYIPSSRMPDDHKLRDIFVELGTRKLREAGLSGTFYDTREYEGHFKRYDIERDFQTFKREVQLFLLGFEAGADHAIDYQDHGMPKHRLNAIRVLYDLPEIDYR